MKSGRDESNEDMVYSCKERPHGKAYMETEIQPQRHQACGNNKAPEMSIECCGEYKREIGAISQIIESNKRSGKRISKLITEGSCYHETATTEEMSGTEDSCYQEMVMTEVMSGTEGSCYHKTVSTEGMSGTEGSCY